MTDVGTLAISLPLILTIFGTIISILTYRLKKKEHDEGHSKEDEAKLKEEAEREKQNDLRLLSIEKDVQYIRLTVDKVDKRLEEHETRISKLEVACRKHTKGGK